VNPTGWQVRTARAEDAMAMARVQLAGWRTAYRSIFPADVLDGADPGEAALKWQQRLATRGAVAFVATAASDVVAIAAGGPPVKAPRLDFPAEIYSLYLLPEWRRRGIGRRLLAATFSAFLGEGADGVYLWCLAGNHDARSFFTRLGGAEVGTAHRPSVGGLVRQSVAITWSRDAMAAVAGSTPVDAPSTAPVKRNVPVARSSHASPCDDRVQIGLQRSAPAASARRRATSDGEEPR
jgi:GNAT superfamily N-acetyltransferase